MPDDMLEDAIMISKKALDEHDFESQGVEVRARLDLTEFSCRLLRLSKSTWMISGSHIGTFSLVRASAATLSMRETALCTSRLNRARFPS